MSATWLPQGWKVMKEKGCSLYLHLRKPHVKPGKKRRKDQGFPASEHGKMSKGLSSAGSVHSTAGCPASPGRLSGGPEPGEGGSRQSRDEGPHITAHPLTHVLHVREGDVFICCIIPVLFSWLPVCKAKGTFVYGVPNPRAWCSPFRQPRHFLWMHQYGRISNKLRNENGTEYDDGHLCPTQTPTHNAHTHISGETHETSDIDVPGKRTRFDNGQKLERLTFHWFVYCVYLTYSNSNLKKIQKRKKMEKGKIILLVLHEYYQRLTLI